MSENIKYCPKCGEKNNATAGYCKKCGAPLQSSSSVSNKETPAISVLETNKVSTGNNSKADTIKHSSHKKVAIVIAGIALVAGISLTITQPWKKQVKDTVIKYNGQTVSYSGELLFGKPNGNGKMSFDTLPDGQYSVEGNFKLGKANGSFEVINYPFENTKIGENFKGYFDGKFDLAANQPIEGTLYLDEGGYIEGSYVNGNLDGTCILSKDGITMSGAFKNNIPSGAFMISEDISGITFESNIDENFNFVPTLEQLFDFAGIIPEELEWVGSDSYITLSNTGRELLKNNQEIFLQNQFDTDVTELYPNITAGKFSELNYSYYDEDPTNPRYDYSIYIQQNYDQYSSVKQIESKDSVFQYGRIQSLSCLSGNNLALIYFIGDKFPSFASIPYGSEIEIKAVSIGYVDEPFLGSRAKWPVYLATYMEASESSQQTEDANTQTDLENSTGGSVADSSETGEVKADSYYIQDQINAALNDPNGYLIPDVNSKYINESDYEDLDKETLRLAINEVYARHGRSFQTEDLNAYFTSKNWYTPMYSAEEFDDSVLNEYERENIKVLANLREQAN